MFKYLRQNFKLVGPTKEFKKYSHILDQPSPLP